MENPFGMLIYAVGLNMHKRIHKLCNMTKTFDLFHHLLYSQGGTQSSPALGTAPLPVLGNGKGFSGFHQVLLPAISGIFLNFISHVQFVSSGVYLPSHSQEDNFIPKYSLLPDTFCCCTNSSCSSTGSWLCRPTASCPPYSSLTKIMCTFFTLEWSKMTLHRRQLYIF